VDNCAEDCIGLPHCVFFAACVLRSEAGTAIGYCSSVLYLTGRIFQIYKNWKRRSAEGLALTMFLFAMAANTFYGMSIVTRAYSLASLRSSAPWLIGSLGTVAMDMTIFMQVRACEPWGSLGEHSCGTAGSWGCRQLVDCRHVLTLQSLAAK
jgi:hypothetical protein